LLKKPNFWSYTSLKGYEVMLKNVEDKIKILEYIIKKMNLPIGEIVQRVNEVKDALLNCNYSVKQVKVRALSRALIGVSETFGEIPFEVGLYFDPIMNVPYIPGSTIKGAVRAATFDLLYREMYLKTNQVKDSEMFAEENCRRIFGGLMGKYQSAGLIGFTDAYPIDVGEHGLLLYPDVINPHYTDRTMTELDVTPTPIIYFTIAPGTKFHFFMFYRRRRGERELCDEDLLESPTVDRLGTVDRGLLYAFFRGVGAKTALGYSRFEILEYEEVKP
jgi:CRISPR-associated protein Cmr6